MCRTFPCENLQAWSLKHFLTELKCLQHNRWCNVCAKKNTKDGETSYDGVKKKNTRRRERCTCNKKFKGMNKKKIKEKIFRKQSNIRRIIFIHKRRKEVRCCQMNLNEIYLITTSFFLHKCTNRHTCTVFWNLYFFFHGNRNKFFFSINRFASQIFLCVLWLFELITQQTEKIVIMFWKKYL